MAFFRDEYICEVLERAIGQTLETFDIKVQEGNKKGDGYLGEMTFISLKHKMTGREYNLAIKKVRYSETENTLNMMSRFYFNEIYQYTVLFPILQDFQKSYPTVNIFDNFPKCYATNSEPGQESLVLENLKMKEYILHPKASPLSEKQIERIFKLYGEYHGLSYAYRYHQPDKFSELTKTLHPNWMKFIKTKMMSDFIIMFLEKVIENFEEENHTEIIDRLRYYHENFVQIYEECLTYKTTYPVLLHGDCWSNNMMYKFDSSGELEDIKLIDFQLASVGSAALDLSYTFYSGVSGGNLDQLQNYLKLYHDTLSSHLERYGCDPKEICSYEKLNEEWRVVCRFGFIMGIIIWSTKTADDLTEMPTVNDLMDGKCEETKENMGMKVNEEDFKKVTMQLVRHMYKNGYL